MNIDEFVGKRISEIKVEGNNLRMVFDDGCELLIYPLARSDDNEKQLTPQLIGYLTDEYHIVDMAVWTEEDDGTVATD